MFPSNYPGIGSSTSQYAGYPGMAQPQQRQKRSMSIGRAAFLLIAIAMLLGGGYLTFGAFNNFMSGATGMIEDPVGADADLDFGDTVELKVKASTKVTIRANGPSLASVRPSGLGRPVAQATTANVGGLGLAITDPDGKTVAAGPAGKDVLIVDRQDGQDSIGIAQFVSGKAGTYTFSLPAESAAGGVTNLSIVVGMDKADKLLDDTFGSGGGMGKIMIGAPIFVVGFIMLIFYFSTRFTKRITGEIFDNLGGGFGGTGPGGPNIL